MNSGVIASRSSRGNKACGAARQQTVLEPASASYWACAGNENAESLRALSTCMRWHAVMLHRQINVVTLAGEVLIQTAFERLLERMDGVGWWNRQVLISGQLRNGIWSHGTGQLDVIQKTVIKFALNSLTRFTAAGNNLLHSLHDLPFH